MDPGFASAVALLLVVCDPIGNIPIFIASLREVPPQRRRFVILRECLIAMGVLAAFAVFGRTVLDLLGLSDLSLQIGGAVVLMIVALRLVFPTAEGVWGTAVEGEPFIVPLAVPAIAGPSAVATVLLMVSRAPARLALWLAAIAVAIGVTALILAFAQRLLQLLGERLLIAVERLTGLLLAAMATEMMLRGIREFVAGLPK